MEAQARERSDQIHESIDLLIHVMRQHHRIVEKRIDGLGVHHSQHRMLMKLSCMGKSASQKELAEAMDVSPACVARMLKSLDAAGLVEKTGGADGRCNAISVLPEGEKLVNDSLALFRQIGGQMFEGVSEAELAAVNGVLRRVQGNLIDMEGREPANGERREGSV